MKLYYDSGDIVWLIGYVSLIIFSLSDADRYYLILCWILYSAVTMVGVGRLQYKLVHPKKEVGIKKC